MNGPAIDLTRHHFVRQLGEITLYGTWLMNDDQEKTEPALVIVPSFRKNGFKPCCVALSAAFKYNSPEYAMRAAKQFAIDMGFELSLALCVKIAEAIHSHLRDLLVMPNDPMEIIIVGEAVITDGGVRRTIQLRDWQQKAQA